MDLYISKQSKAQNQEISNIKTQEEQIRNNLQVSNYKTSNKRGDLRAAISVKEENDNFRTDIFHSIQSLSNYLYFILLSPCKVVTTKTESGKISIEFASSPLRKIIWAFYQILATFSALQVGIFANISSDKKVHEDPVRLFYIFGMLVYCSGVIIWPILLLSKKDEIKSIFYNCSLVCSDSTARNKSINGINVIR